MHSSDKSKLLLRYHGTNSKQEEKRDSFWFQFWFNFEKGTHLSSDTNTVCLVLSLVAIVWANLPVFHIQTKAYNKKVDVSCFCTAILQKIAFSLCSQTNKRCNAVFVDCFQNTVKTHVDMHATDEHTIELPENDSMLS